MQKTILSVLHNIKDYQYYDNSAMPLTKEDADIIVAFFENEEVQKCIPKVPVKKALSPLYPKVTYRCPNCGFIINKHIDIDKCSACEQKIRWVENETEEDNSIGSSIFDNFGVNINNK